MNASAAAVPGVAIPRTHPMTRTEIEAVCAAGPTAVVALVEQLLATIEQLTARVQQLERQQGRNSQNSNKPPSSDGFAKKTKSRREKSGKKPGGQPGHGGQTLRAVAEPNHVLCLVPDQCAACSADLREVPILDMQCRQVFDIPPLALEVTEYQVGKRVCPGCGKEQCAEFPAAVTQPVQYGPRILALLVYLLVYQLLPYARVSELLGDLFTATPGGGTLATAVERCYDGLAASEARIQGAIRQAECAHFDETSERVGGKRWWWHSASTPTLTHYTVNAKRGRAGSDAGGILPEFTGRAMHDGWSVYFQYACEHALCNAHHLRELIAVSEQGGQEWAGELIRVLVDSHREVAAARAAGERELSPERLAEWVAEYRRWVTCGLEANPAREAPPAAPGESKPRGRRAQSPARNLLLRLQRYERETLALLHDFAVPFDNNQGERDLRMLKVHQKISGGFRSEGGAVAFGRIRGYLSTLRKQGQPLLAALESVFHGKPLQPQISA